MGDSYTYTYENYDSFWLTLGHDTVTPPLTGNNITVDKYGHYRYTTGSPAPDTSTKELLRKYDQQLKKFSDTLKDVTPVATAPVKTEQEEIDAAVEEAIAKPRREAEIAKRVAAVTKLGADTYEVGTVLRFSRVFGGKTSYTYAILKATDDRWYITGGSQVNRTVYSPAYTWEEFVKWATTGQSLIFDLEVVSGWTAIPLA